MSYQYHRLGNGIRIIHRFEKSNISHVGLIVNTGTRDEMPKESGMAHFIEHMVFKGTKNRSAWHVLSRIENVGGEMNAFTTKEETCIHASFLSPFYENCIELFSDVTFHSVYPEKEIKKERDVVIDEINSYNDNPAELIYDDFESLLFNNHPLGHNILGSLNTVEKFSRQDIFRFINKNYSTNQMVLASVGNISFVKLLKLAEKYFGKIPGSEKDKKRSLFNNYQPEVRQLEKDSYLTHLVIGNLSFARSNPKKSGMVLLNNLLGGQAMNTRLNLAIRERYGIGYTIESVYQPYTDTGVFAIYLGIDKKQLDKSIFLVERELKKLRDTKLGDIQLHRIKRQTIGQLAISSESRLNETLGIAKSHLFRHVVRTVPEIINDIEKVTASEILDIANEIFDEKNLSTLIFKGK